MIKVNVTLGGNTFEMEEVPSLDPDFRAVFSAWLNAQQPGSSAEALEASTARLKAANDAAEKAVTDNTAKE